MGPAFSATLLAILGAHEMGHYAVARRLGVPASPPYFIPLPPVGGLPGTLGAIIAIGADRADRTRLAAVAAAGPIAGFVVALPLFVFGASLETEVVELSGDVLIFGNSLLTAGVEALVAEELPAGHDRIAHPVYFAAWVGLFITGLNLLPMGQLDGGHLLYALIPGQAHRISRICQVILLVVGALGFVGMAPMLAESFGLEAGVWFDRLRPLRQAFAPVFLVWGLLAGVFGLRHPPIRDERQPPARSAWILAGVCGVLLVLVAVPNGIWLDRRP